jgi:hypothetical protein
MSVLRRRTAPSGPTASAHTPRTSRATTTHGARTSRRARRSGRSLWRSLGHEDSSVESTAMLAADRGQPRARARGRRDRAKHAAAPRRTSNGALPVRQGDDGSGSGPGIVSTTHPAEVGRRAFRSRARQSRKSGRHGSATSRVVHWPTSRLAPPPGRSRRDALPPAGGTSAAASAARRHPGPRGHRAADSQVSEAIMDDRLLAVVSSAGGAAFVRLAQSVDAQAPLAPAHATHAAPHTVRGWAASSVKRPSLRSDSTRHCDSFVGRNVRPRAIHLGSRRHKLPPGWDARLRERAEDAADQPSLARSSSGTQAGYRVVDDAVVAERQVERRACGGGVSGISMGGRPLAARLHAALDLASFRRAVRTPSSGRRSAGSRTAPGS